MDGFAAVRAKAIALRREVGVDDSVAAPDLVVHAGRQLGLTLRSVPAADPEIAGAHGLLDRQFREVLYRDDLADDQKAEVIAHEIGHFRVHDGPEAGFYPRIELNGGDPSQRIETYGIKERREAQANVFAREFILPRSLARRLFLEGRRATQIARDLKVPYDTTLQQLADGLLLPNVPLIEEEPRAPEPLNSAQLQAVKHRGSPYLLGAGPGTGKTKTLVARIADLLADGVPASKVLALTFSNKAALELAERVHAIVGGDAINIWTGTFHAFGLDTIRKHHQLFGVSADPKVVDNSAAVEMLEDALPALDIRHYLNLLEPELALRDIVRAIARAKDELCSPQRYAELAEQMRSNARTDEEIIAAQRAAEVAVVYEHYQRQLTEEGAVDYGDLIMRPTLVLQADPDFRNLMRDRFSHVHVDEYQDINRASAMLVRAIAGDGDRLWVVGDARQSIYRFRGAAAANMARFEEDYPTATRESLDVNYRSTTEIVDSYSAFGRSMSVTRYAGPMHLSAARGSSADPPVIVVAQDDESELDYLAGSIRDLEAAGVPLNRQTVLSRSNGSLARIAEGLDARGVPVLFLGPLFDRPEVRDLLCVLSLVADDTGAALVRVAEFPEYSVPLSDAQKLMAHARATAQRVFDLLARLEEVADLSEAGRASLLSIARHLHGATQGTTPWLLASRFLFDGSDYFRTVLAGQSPSDGLRRVAVRQLLDCLRNMPVTGRGAPIRRALDRVRRMILLSDERDLRQLPPELDGLEGVRLMTIHASKGLEFDAVHLPGLYSGALPTANRPPACPPPVGLVAHQEDEDAHEAEEECILFVALSRARSHLRLYRPARRGVRNSNPSRYLERVPLSSPRPSQSVARVRPEIRIHPVTDPPAPAELTAADIERYTACPRRFFYERVLGFARRSRTGAYLDAHGCLQAAIGYVRSLGTDVPYDPNEAERIFEAAWAESSARIHPFGPAYRRLVLQMLANLHTSADGTATLSGRLSTSIGDETVIFTADRVTHDGAVPVVRNYRSGRQSSGDADRLSATILLKAAMESLGTGARVETHYLMSGSVLEVNQSDAKFRKRVADCETAIRDIRLGLFEPNKSDFQCPRCPYLFNCPAPLGAVAEGSIS